MISDRDFKKAAALLKRASPTDEWANFMGAFQAYTFTQIAVVVDAPRDTLEMAQGVARGAKKLLQLLEECDREKPKETQS